MKFNPSLILTTSALALTIGISSPAFAQTPEPVGPADDACVAPATEVDAAKCAETAQVAANPASVEDDAIVVTGSRIRRNQFNTADAIQLITRDEATQAGFNSTAEVLQSTAVTGGSPQISNIFGGFVTAGGPGANTVSLRGLGTTRTLVLLNGRRIAPAGTRGQVGAADLNVLPNALVDRIEILSTGASSIYGSDAVAGVINILTRPKVNGLEIEMQQNVAEVGAGRSARYSAVGGFSADRFSVVGSVEYYNRKELQFGDVNWTQCQTSYRKANADAEPGTGDFIDPQTGEPKCYPTGVTGESGVTVNTLGTPNFGGSTVVKAPGVPAGFTAACNRFRPNELVTTGAMPGFECVGGTGINLNVRDTFPDSIMHNSLISPAKTFTGFLGVNYESDILGNAVFYTEILATRRKSEQNSNRQFTIDYADNSPLIPAALQFPGNFLPAQAGGITGTTPIALRVFADYGNYNNRQTADFVNAYVGARGDFFVPDWEYDAYVGKSWSDADYTTDLILTDRLAQSLDVVVGPGGVIQCRNTLGGCVAAPAISPEVIGGEFPQDWLDFVVSPVTGHTKYRESIASLNIDGPLPFLSLPGGDVQVALGTEYRKSRIDDSPSEESVRGNLYGFTSSTPTRGKDSVWEVFGEVELPILRNVTMVDELTFNASARYTHYKSYGGQTTYKFGGLYSPINWLSFRGSYGTSYRAPALFEQYLGATSGFQSQNNDPCNNWGNRPVGDPRRDNCEAEGLAPDFVATSSIRVLQRGGAETGLSAETSKALMLGGVLQPSFGDFGDLSFAADYFKVKVENGVSQLSFSTTLSQCYDDPRFRENSICDNVVRDSTAPYGLTVTTGYLNISNSEVSGLDFNLRHSVKVGPGTVRLGGAVTKYFKRYNQTLPTDEIFDLIGTINNPEWTGTFDASYYYGPWNFRYGLEWIDGMNSDAEFLGISDALRDTYVMETDDYFLHSASVRHETDKWGIVLGVRNLFDKKPPQISSGFYNRAANSPLYSGYDYLGRTFFINFSGKIK